MTIIDTVVSLKTRFHDYPTKLISFINRAEQVPPDKSMFIPLIVSKKLFLDVSE
jgi:hypothetical protein